jgi:hypothetical protein
VLGPTGARRLPDGTPPLGPTGARRLPGRTSRRARPVSGYGAGGPDLVPGYGAATPLYSVVVGGTAPAARALRTALTR